MLPESETFIVFFQAMSQFFSPLALVHCRPAVHVNNPAALLCVSARQRRSCLADCQPHVLTRITWLRESRCVSSSRSPTNICLSALRVVPSQRLMLLYLLSVASPRAVHCTHRWSSDSLDLQLLLLQWPRPLRPRTEGSRAPVVSLSTERCVDRLQSPFRNVPLSETQQQAA